MMEWWYVIVIVVVLVLVVVYVRNRQERMSQRSRPDVNAATRNYVGEREDTRLGGMSAEDRDWEQASLQRNRDRQVSPPTPGGSQAAPLPEGAERRTGE